MANINRVHLLGRITQDIELKYTQKGTAVASVNLAINRHRTDDNGNKIEETTFVEVQVWGRQAELASQYLAKGREVYFEGRLQLDQWEDKQTGQKRSRLKVVAEGMQFIGGGGGGGNGDAGRQQSPARARPPMQQEPAMQELEEDDIPF